MIKKNNNLLSSSIIIDYSQELSRKFIEKHCKDELIFFDNIWEIYEPELKKWIDSPPLKWHFKIPKAKLMGALRFSDRSQLEGLTTPKIVEVLLCTLFRLAKEKDDISMNRIGKIIAGCGEKLSSSDRLLTINYFAPFILQDLNLIKITPEKKIKKEYFVYSHEKRKGEFLERYKYLQLIEITKDDYIIWIDEIGNKFLVRGKKQTKIGPIQKKALKLLIKNAGMIVKYKDLFESLSRVAKSTEYDGWYEEHMEEYINRVQKWISDLHKNTTPKGILKEKYLKNIENIGYMLEVEENTKYCLIDYFR